MTCCRCDNAAEFYPVMLIYAPRRTYPDAPPARSICGIPVCRAHQSDITLDYLITDLGWRQIEIAFRSAGRVLPDRSATELEFIPIDSEEAQRFDRDRFRDRN